MLVWRKLIEEFQKQNIQPVVKRSGGGIMVWGFMADPGIGIEFIDDIMD